MINLLHVVVIVKTLYHALYLFGKLGVARVNSGLRYHGYFGGKEAVAKLFQFFAHSGEIVCIGVYFKHIVLGNNVFRARFKRLVEDQSHLLNAETELFK